MSKPLSVCRRLLKRLNRAVPLMVLGAALILPVSPAVAQPGPSRPSLPLSIRQTERRAVPMRPLVTRPGRRPLLVRRRVQPAPIQPAARGLRPQSTSPDAVRRPQPDKLNSRR